MTMETRVLRTVRRETATTLWEIYEQSFVRDLERYPHNQMNYDREGFLDAMADETIVKFVLTQDNQPIGFAAVIDHRHPEHSPWTSFRAFTTRGATEESFYYINVLAVDSRHQNAKVGTEIIDSIIDWATAEKGRSFGGFDAPEEKELIAGLVRSRCALRGLKVEVIGAQKYYLISPDKTGPNAVQ